VHARQIRDCAPLVDTERRSVYRREMHHRAGAKFTALLLVALTSACMHTQQTRNLVAWAPGHDVVVVEDTRVFPATGPDVLEHQTVILADRKIAAIAPAGPAATSALAGVLSVYRVGANDVAVIDGRGKTLLPGLVDAHLHTQVTGAAPWYVVLPNPEHVLQESLYAGVTSAHDMGGPLDDVLALKKQLNEGTVIGPRLIVAGPMLTAPGGYPGSYIERVLPLLAPIFLPQFTRSIATPAEGKATVDALADAGVDHIKICLADTPDGTPVMDPATIEAITSEAHAKHKKVFAHIDTAKNARLAADNGVDGLVHDVHSTPLSDDDAKDLAAHQVTVAPTLITFERLYELSTNSLSLSKLERESVAKNLQESLRQMPKGYALNEDLASWLGHLSRYRNERLHDNVKKLHDAGVKILVGTDGHGSTASFPAGIHEEMRRLVEAGVPNVDVLLGATNYAAHESLANPSFGTIEVGKDADLLLVDGNPLVNISDTERIDRVIVRGHVVNRLH
jgi:imidazolonepropionase-like amidohydrolase